MTRAQERGGRQGSFWPLSPPTWPSLCAPCSPGPRGPFCGLSLVQGSCDGDSFRSQQLGSPAPVALQLPQVPASLPTASHTDPGSRARRLESP